MAPLRTKNVLLNINDKVDSSFQAVVVTMQLLHIENELDSLNKSKKTYLILSTDYLYVSDFI